MRSLLILTFLLRAASAYTQDIPPPPPPPPPPPSEMELNSIKKSSELDLKIHVPITASLTDFISNDCKGTVSPKGSGIFFNLNQEFKEITKGTYEFGIYHISILELPKLYNFNFLKDSLSRGIKPRENEYDLNHDFLINGDRAYLIERCNKYDGGAYGILIISGIHNDYVIRLLFNIREGSKKSYISDFIRSICLGKNEETDPMKEMPVTVDTSFTHFNPKSAGMGCVVFLPDGVEGLGMNSFAPRFQIHHITDEVSVEDAFDMYLSVYSKSGMEAKEISSEKFKSNNFTITAKNFSLYSEKFTREFYLFIGVMENKSMEGTIYFIGSDMEGENDMITNWKKTIKSIKLK